MRDLKRLVNSADVKRNKSMYFYQDIRRTQR